MKKLLIPLVGLLFGIGSGVGAGLFLAPKEGAAELVDTNGAETAAHESDAADAGHAAPSDDANGDAPADDHAAPTAPDDGHGTPVENEFAKLGNQFVVPLVTDGKVTGLVVISLSLEVPPDGAEAAFAIEPKLRDSFLQVMFDHANIGGFSGNFTDSSNMRTLRQELLRSAKAAAGDLVTDVLILDIVRQDI